MGTSNATNPEGLEARVEAGRALALSVAPYARDALAAVQVVFTDRLPQVTMASDKYWRVYVHLALSWSPGEIGWGLLHEVLGHLVRGHQRGHGEVAVAQHGAEIVNVAMDCEIESWKWPLPLVRPPGGVHPSLFRLAEGETWPWYLQRLLKHRGRRSEGGKKSGAGAPRDCGSCAGGGSREYEEPPDGECITPGSVRERQVLGRVARAVSQSRGSVPAGLQVWADAYIAGPTVPWDHVLRELCAQVIAAGIQDMVGPARERHGVLIPRWRAQRPTVAVVADTSGSMSEHGSHVLGETVGITAAGADVDVCWVDTEPRWQRRVRGASDLAPVGGGGTDLRPAIEEARRGTYDAVVIVTDGLTPWPDVADPREVLVVYGNANVPPQWSRVLRPSLAIGADDEVG